MFPAEVEPWPMAATAAGLLACILSAVGLLRAGRFARDMARQRAVAEQILAEARAEGERLRVTLSHAERGLANRVDEMRHGMEQRLSELAVHMVREQAEARVQLEVKLRDMAELQARHLADIHRGVNEALHQAVEQQMQASFARVLEQFAAVQKAVGDVQAMAGQIGDLRRVFSNVKARGAWGEAQLRTLLDDLLPDGYVMNARLHADGAEVVEFAVRLPGRGDSAKLLPLDAKFPLADYEALLAAEEAGDTDGERMARRALEARLKLEGRKIAKKYLVPPLTTDFAVLYLPSDGLYAEVARIPGLIDELGRMHVLVMGPGLLPALLRTVRLGYVTLALEEKAGQIGQLLGAVKHEMLRMDQVLERLARSAGAMGRTIEEARRRTRSVGRRLRQVEFLPDPSDCASFEVESDTLDAQEPA